MKWDWTGVGVYNTFHFGLLSSALSVVGILSAATSVNVKAMLTGPLVPIALQSVKGSPSVCHMMHGFPSPYQQSKKFSCPLKFLMLLLLPLSGNGSIMPSRLSLSNQREHCPLKVEGKIEGSFLYTLVGLFCYLCKDVLGHSHHLSLKSEYFVSAWERVLV